VSEDENDHFIFLFDKENRFFDQTCKIEREATSYKNKDKICKQVIDSK
jgi:hypothetical protein